ncbi:MAG: hypothetical protein AAGK74_00325 [Chloroflexota bacterium]
MGKIIQIGERFFEMTEWAEAMQKSNGITDEEIEETVLAGTEVFPGFYRLESSGSTTNVMLDEDDLTVNQVSKV